MRLPKLISKRQMAKKSEVGDVNLNFKALLLRKTSVKVLSSANTHPQTRRLNQLRTFQLRPHCCETCSSGWLVTVSIETHFVGEITKNAFSNVPFHMIVPSPLLEIE
jgi:hypothetical protein